MRASSWVLLLIGALLTVGLLAWLLTERRWAGSLYCIERPGTLWNGLTALPPGLTPECPDSQSYRQEVRTRFSRVERYRADGWNPRALLPLLKQGGYRQTTDDDVAPGNYAAFLSGPGGTLQYLATRQAGQTVFTLSGRP
ncbi:hypothetical protein [Deinococcus ruber]|uniref:Uncharacterized protein n=1 Tax=Deinococcus ruber TaxID=1848197 RepID=A0A918CJ41_9DEIO|nr:hypothetical protein [Deinococcus ruber]GGR27220.1 hypothetical protein GCM10008957_43230 [Deinococcus ruber]